ncbi:MAG TPA: alpha/beta fold hydrolase [Nocardioidaceae bacterium]|nr:alpha/beta fold hydrolase [Nocardioidaceae bacterium]
MLRIRGLDVRIRVQGEGEPLLLLNGLTRPLESWEPFAEALSGRTIVSFDAPGVGGSPTPILPLPISMLAGLAASVLDDAGFATVDVLGFSHGGAVAQQLAAQASSRVRRLVLVSTSCGVGATPGSQDALRARTPSEAHPWPRPDALGLLWNSLAISTWSSIAFLGAIRAPTLVVCGERDRVVPPVNSSMLARRIPGADLVMLSAGHDLQRRGPARLLVETVEPFLAASGLVPEPLTAGA